MKPGRWLQIRESLAALRPEHGQRAHEACFAALIQMMDDAASMRRCLSLISTAHLPDGQERQSLIGLQELATKYLNGELE